MTTVNKQSDALSALAAILGGVKPPSRSKVLLSKLITVLGNSLAVLLSVAFLVGLVDVVLLLISVARKLI